MKRNQSIVAVLLSILALAFIVFVAFMQNNFNNPEFDQLTVTTTGNIDTSEDVEVEEDDKVDDESVAGAAGSVVGDEEETDADTDSNTEENEAVNNEDVITSTQTVEAETLNAREGPGVDYEITGVLVEGQVVTVEDGGDDWVKILTSEFEGYVNKHYLSGE